MVWPVIFDPRNGLQCVAHVEASEPHFRFPAEVGTRVCSGGGDSGGKGGVVRGE